MWESLRIISLADLSEKEVDCNIFSIFESDKADMM